jgi:uncharacterized membrane protein
MDGIVIILAIVAVIATIVVLRRSGDGVRQVEALREEVRHLTKRIYELEKVGQPAVREPVKTREPVSEPAIKPEVATPVGIKEPPVYLKPQPPVAAPLPPVVHAAAPETTPPVAAKRAPEFLAGAPQPAAQKQSQRRQWADLEERLGTNWLNKIGTAAFVIGVALLLNYSMHYLGARGKIALGYSLSAALIAAGVFGERKDRYRIAARAALGGGWALAYFTTYAMHNVAAVRLINSASLGFTLLFMVAVAMVAHSLRYNSQVATGFAYVLAFVSVGAGEIPIGALVATVVLAASLAVILRQRRWYALEPLAIIATYVLHWIWVNQIYARIGGHKPFPQFAISVALLTAYWTVYLVSYFLRTEASQIETQLLTASFLLNAAGYLIVLHYQSFHPAWRFWFLLAAGAVYLGVSAFSRRTGRRLSFILASTLGAALMLAAVPYRYSGGNQEILWLIEAEALLIAGWRLRDSHLRNLGWIGSAVLAGYAVAHDLYPRLFVRMHASPATAWLLAGLAAAFYFNSRLRERPAESPAVADKIAREVASGVATGFAMAAAWVGFSYFWPGLIWALTAAALIEFGKRFDDRNLEICGHAAAGLALLRLLSINLVFSVTWHHISLRLLTIALAGAVFYVLYGRLAHWQRKEGAPPVQESKPWWLARAAALPAAYSAGASLLVSILLWNEITTAGVALAWGVFALTLFEAGRTLTDLPLRMQGYLLLGASFARIFVADLNSTAHLWIAPTPIVTVGLLAAIYYYTGSTSNDSRLIPQSLRWLGTAALVALFRFEFPAEWVAVSWAFLAIAFFLIGTWRRSTTFLAQCYVITLLVGVRCAFDNFYQIGRWHFTSVRTATVMAAALPLYVLFAITQASRVRNSDANPEGTLSMRAFWRGIINYPQRLFFFVPTILLTVLLSLEVRRAFLTAAWGLEALFIFLVVLKMDERLYRWFSLALFLCCVGRVVTVDVWNFDALGRIVSFLGLGVALLAVSFLYARHRELLRKML